MRYIVEALDTLTIHRKEMFCEATCRGSFIGHVLSEQQLKTYEEESL